MNNDFRIEVELQQLTPMLHFQGIQHGACLRASEVKPKLDRFVFNCLKKRGIELAALPAGWTDLHAEEADSEPASAALRYKMRFRANGENHCSPDIHPLYFGNRGTNPNKAFNLFIPNGMHITLLVLTDEVLPRKIRLWDSGPEVNTLSGILRALIPAFFELHCFGARSNKGFGSFRVKGSNLSPEELQQLMASNCEAMFWLENFSPEYDSVRRLDDVYVLSGMMKGGFSRLRNGAKYPGAIQELFHNQRVPVGTEKDFIKAKVFTEYEKDWYWREVCRKQGAWKGPQEYGEYRFARVLLGLTEQYAFGIGSNSKRYKVTPEDKEIQRFANPVVFKPRENGLLILVHAIPDAILNTSYQFARERTQNHKRLDPPREFDMVHFVAEFLSPLKRQAKIVPHEWIAMEGGSFQKGGRKIEYSNTLKSLRLQAIFEEVNRS